MPNADTSNPSETNSEGSPPWYQELVRGRDKQRAREEHAAALIDGEKRVHDATVKEQKYKRWIRNGFLIVLGVLVAVGAIIGILAYIKSDQSKTRVKAVFTDKTNKEYKVTYGDKEYTHRVPDIIEKKYDGTTTWKHSGNELIGGGALVWTFDTETPGVDKTLTLCSSDPQTYELEKILELKTGKIIADVTVGSDASDTFTLTIGPDSPKEYKKPTVLTKKYDGTVSGPVFQVLDPLSQEPSLPFEWRYNVAKPTEAKTLTLVSTSDVYRLTNTLELSGDTVKIEPIVVVISPIPDDTVKFTVTIDSQTRTYRYPEDTSKDYDGKTDGPVVDDISGSPVPVMWPEFKWVYDSHQAGRGKALSLKAVKDYAYIVTGGIPISGDILIPMTITNTTDTSFTVDNTYTYSYPSTRTKLYDGGNVGPNVTDSLAWQYNSSDPATANRLTLIATKDTYKLKGSIPVLLDGVRITAEVVVSQTGTDKYTVAMGTQTRVYNYPTSVNKMYDGNIDGPAIVAPSETLPAIWPQLQWVYDSPYVGKNRVLSLRAVNDAYTVTGGNQIQPCKITMPMTVTEQTATTFAVACPGNKYTYTIPSILTKEYDATTTGPAFGSDTLPLAWRYNSADPTLANSLTLVSIDDDFVLEGPDFVLSNSGVGITAEIYVSPVQEGVYAVSMNGKKIPYSFPVGSKIKMHDGNVEGPPVQPVEEQPPNIWPELEWVYDSPEIGRDRVLTLRAVSPSYKFRSDSIIQIQNCEILMPMVVEKKSANSFTVKCDGNTYTYSDIPISPTKIYDGTTDGPKIEGGALPLAWAYASKDVGTTTVQLVSTDPMYVIESTDILVDNAKITPRMVDITMGPVLLIDKTYYPLNVVITDHDENKFPEGLSAEVQLLRVFEAHMAGTAPFRPLTLTLDNKVQCTNYIIYRYGDFGVDNVPVNPEFNVIYYNPSAIPLYAAGTSYYTGNAVQHEDHIYALTSTNSVTDDEPGSNNWMLLFKKK